MKTKQIKRSILRWGSGLLVTGTISFFSTIALMENHIDPALIPSILAQASLIMISVGLLLLIISIVLVLPGVFKKTNAHWKEHKTEYHSSFGAIGQLISLTFISLFSALAYSASSDENEYGDDTEKDHYGDFYLNSYSSNYHEYTIPSDD